MSRLTRDDWATAALVALSEGGLAAIAVEPLAARLHTTKGSFYWHFRNRDDLVDAALDTWRQAGTAAVIAQLEATGLPAASKIRQLFAQVFGPTAHADVNLALLANADHPAVAPVLTAVTEQRLAYVTELFRRTGQPEVQARRRALLAYSAYLGQLHLRRAAPHVLPASGAATEAYADDVLAMLLG